MFGRLPELMGRNFAVGYFLPAAAIVVAAIVMVGAFASLPKWLTFDDANALMDAAVVGALTWLLAIALLAINYPLVRFLEGYWPASLWSALDTGAYWQKRFAADVTPALEAQIPVDQARSVGREPPPTPEGHSARLRQAMAGFPDHIGDVLPTRFGNVYRAIEVYSRVVYGLDAIPSWVRLQAIVPEEFQARIDESKAQLDFTANMVLAGSLTLLAYAGMLAWSCTEIHLTPADHRFIVSLGYCGVPVLWLPLIGAAVAFASYRALFSALHQYGQFVMSVFDLYRRELADQLDLAVPRSPQAEREMWVDVSRMMIYRSAAAWDRLTKYRKPGGTEL